MTGVVQRPAAQSAPRVGPGSYSASARRSLWRFTNKARCQTKQRATSRFDHYCNEGYSRATDLEPVKGVFSVRIRESQADLGQMNGLGVSRQVDSAQVN